MARTRTLTTAAVALTALGLAACNESERRASAGGGLCIPFAGQATQNANATPSTPAGPSSGVDDCLHRWGYALAASSDPADQVSAAVIAACTPTISRWNQEALAPAPGPTGGSAPSQAPSLITGEETNAMAERYRYAQDRALFYVVQARAGKCAAPPMRDGVPDETPRAG